MEFKQIVHDKKQYIDLLLLADEQENMIDKYLNRGEMFAIFDNGMKTVCVVTDEGNKIFEIKNIATCAEFQGQGYGTQMIVSVFAHYKNLADTILVGTGDSPMTISFYLKCGFVESHQIKNFFIDNYMHPIYECGKQLVDMIYLRKDLRIK